MCLEKIGSIPQYPVEFGFNTSLLHIWVSLSKTHLCPEGEQRRWPRVLKTQPLPSGSTLSSRLMTKEVLEPQREAMRDIVFRGAGAQTQLGEFKISFLKIQWVLPSHCNTLTLKNGKFIKKRQRKSPIFLSHNIAILFFQAFSFCLRLRALIFFFNLRSYKFTGVWRKMEQKVPIFSSTSVPWY